MPELGDSLSQRELEVLQCVAEGASNKEIAASLLISQNTVKVHLRNIFSKLGASSRTEATTTALQQRLINIASEDAAAFPSTAAVVPDSPELPLPASEEPEEQLEDEPTSPAETTSDLISVPPAARPFSWRTAAATAVLTIAVVAALWFGFGQRALKPGPEATPELFQETRLGDSDWFQSRPLPLAVAHMAAAAVGVNVYQIGGETADGVVGTVNVFDTTTQSWRQAASKPTVVADASAAVLFGEIYVPGGRAADGTPTNVVEVYSPANDAWRAVTAIPQPIAGGLAISDGSFLYLFGGWDESGFLDTNFVYDVGADSWRPLPSMPHPAAFAAGKAVTGQLYVVGGRNGEADLSSCNRFDTSTLTWSSCPDMLLPRSGAGAATVLNKLYVIGGANETDEILYSEVYDPNTQTWQVVNTPELSEFSTWSDLGVASVEVRIFALGGKHGQTLTSDNVIYAPRVYKTFIPAASSGDSN